MITLKAVTENKLSWKQLGIAKKFSLVFSLFVVLIFVIVATSYLSFLSIRDAEEQIKRSVEIQQLVVEMDRSLEKARRLHGDFFLHYQNIGLSEAHQLYALKSVQQIAKAITLSSRLKNILAQPERNRTISKKEEVEISLYLSSAKRFANTSIEAVELITRRVAPEQGLEVQIENILKKLQIHLHSSPEGKSQHLHEKAFLFYKDYLIHRHRFLMQSAFNVLGDLKQELGQYALMEAEIKRDVLQLLEEFTRLSHQLLDVDRAVSEKFHDFSLQAQAIVHIPSTLLKTVQKELEEAEHRVIFIHRLTGNIMLILTCIGVAIVLIIAKVMNRTISDNIVTLTEAAKEVRDGNMDIQVPQRSQDELGQLTSIFNKMILRLKGSVDNLEGEVQRRTRELSASEERFRSLANNLPRISVQGYDSERRVFFWNQASEDIYGYNESEAIGRCLEDLIIPAARKDRVIQEIENWLEKDVPIPPSELVMQHKEGHEVFVYSSHFFFSGDSDNKEFYCADIDLAELKLAQEKGKYSESLYRELFNQSSSGIAVYETPDDGKTFIFKDFNRAGEGIERVPLSVLLGQNVAEVFPVVEKSGLLDIFRQVWKTGTAAHFPFCFYKEEVLKGCREHRVYKLPSGELVTVYDDTTSQKKIEEDKKRVEKRLQRAKKMEAIAVLAGGVAHDLNNILSGIIGYPELLLLQLAKDSELRPPIEAIKESGERAAAVVADLLTVARGVATTKNNAVLNALVLEYLDTPEFRKLRRIYPNISYTHTLSKEPVNIFCSTVHVKKCLMNLVTNASEAVHGKGSVSLSVRVVTPDRNWAKNHDLEPIEYGVVRVADNGSGIAQEDIEHIFEPFYTKKVMGKSGTGLGLAVVYNTVQDHQGTVVVNSDGKGTVFDLYFPTTKTTAIAQPEKKSDLLVNGQGGKLLVVDDESLQLDICSRMLKKFGYTVVCKKSGEEAVDYLQDTAVDLVLLDMIMDPGMNGRETYEEIIKLYPGQRALIISGYSESEEVKRVIRLGAKGFLKKPYAMEELGDKVREILDQE